MNMFKSVKATTAKEYFEMLPEERRKPMAFLRAFIRKTVPSLEPNFLYNMPGYGSFTYTNSKKQTLPWPVIGLASQKGHISIYVCAMKDGGYVAERYKDELGKVKVGKSCISLKKVEDLDLKTFAKVLKLAAKYPGFLGLVQ